MPMTAYWSIPVLSVPRQMRITFSSLESIPCRSHEIASEYHIICFRQCLPDATFRRESDVGVQEQDHIKSVIFKIWIRSLK